MRGALVLRNLSLYARNRHFSLYLRPTPPLSNIYTNFTPKIDTDYNAQPLSWFPSRIRCFSSDDGTQDPDPNPETESSIPVPVETEKEAEAAAVDLDDIDSKEFKALLREYFPDANVELLPKVFESVLKRKFLSKHEDTDDELVDELRRNAFEHRADDEDFESDFEAAHKTDDEIEDLCDARGTVVNRMKPDPTFNMDDRKWDALNKEGTDGGYIKHLKECEDLLDDMQNWDKLLPDEIKQKILAKFNEINGMIDRGEVSFDEGFEIYQKYEDEMVSECKEIIKREEKKRPANEIEVLDDRQGKGPELRWVTRVVLSSGGDSWHPKKSKSEVVYYCCGVWLV